MSKSNGFVGRSLGHALVAASLIASSALAQTYPSKPVRLIVPWSAGSGTDLMARSFAHKLGETLGQQVVVDNRGGAGAIIGSEVAAKSPPDGYTLYIGGSVSMAISPALYSKVSYDPVKDFTPVSLVSQFFNALSVHPSVPAKNVKEFIGLARARPGELLMGSAGNGSTSHLAGELFKKTAKVNLTHVPYKSGGQLVTGVVSGESHLSFSPVSTALTHMKTGKLRTLAVTSAKRLPSLPALPTVAETVPGYEFGGWQAVFVPAGTSQEIVRRLNAATVKAVNTPEFREYLAKEGSELVGSTPEHLATFVRAEVAKNAELIRSAAIKPE
ncbi:MAG TPA: tripartite tricarboxylate transporter substrate binding protein [Burkholderiales bacterium]|nr:tripartite tricarboxylate transporter substrate binding protein [Burkholderiales bacterium]